MRARWAVILAVGGVLALLAAFAPPTAATGPIEPQTAPGAPVLSAAAINDSAITVSWSVPTGTVSNYTLAYAHFYGRQVAYINVPGGQTVYNVTDLGFGLTYYFTVWAWTSGTEGPASNVAPAQTNPQPTAPVQPGLSTSTIVAITMLSILGSVAFSFAVTVYVSERKVRPVRASSAVAMGRSRPPAPQNRPYTAPRRVHRRG